ncbi:MAG: cell division protein SepF [Clostridia bacterium]|nr:cell division protein SepF [Clostridia bacterium]MBP3559165.1 cell division protein SepF [Clostridia bacterium]MBQ6838465.1 cell division protein SepF [Clostridia bacterium]
MSFMDYWKKFTNTNDEEDYEENQFEAQEENFDNRSFSNVSSYEDYERESPRTAQRARRTTNDPSRVVDVRTTAMLQVVLVKPDKFEDARGIADHLNEKRTVVLNLEAASRDVSRRLIDLLNGVAYANGGQLKKVSTNTYIITPYNVNVSGDLLDELESTGVFF